MLGTNIKKYRELKGLTQDELSNKLNKSKGVVSKWENGENKPDADTIGKICSILGISPNILMDWKGNDSNIFANPTYVIGENGEREVSYTKNVDNKSREELLEELGVTKTNYIMNKDNIKTELTDNEYDFLINSLNFFRKK